MKEENLENIYSLCPLLNYEVIKKELENYLKGFNLKNTIKVIDNYLCTFTNKNDCEIFMTIGKSSIKLTIMHNEFIEEIEIQGKNSSNNEELYSKYNLSINIESKKEQKKEDITIKIKRIEKRNKGIILTDIFKTYSSTNYYDKIYILSDIHEKQLISTKNKLEENLYNFNFNNTKARDILSRFKKIDDNKLQLLSDYNHSFTVYINQNKSIKTFLNNDNNPPIQVFSNGTNVSNVYTLIKGYDAISRIYDLYNGVITPNNEQDIDLIKKGSLNSKCFNLKSLKGIDSYIDNLIGTKTEISNDYLEYLKKLFRNKYQYTDEIILSREDLLKIILAKPKKNDKNQVLIKKYI